MSTIGQIYYNVVRTDTTPPTSGEISSGIDIFQDIVSASHAQIFTKVGIQAPPGTKAIIDENKTIIVGKTGIWEIGDGSDGYISIHSLRFVRPRRYIKDIAASNAYIEDGIAEMAEADEEYNAAMKELYKDRIPDVFLPDGVTPNPESDAFWEKHDQITGDYFTKFEEGLNKYNTGCNGIYVLPFPNETNNPANYDDLYNVIIDFIYE